MARPFVLLRSKEFIMRREQVDTQQSELSEIARRRNRTSRHSRRLIFRRSYLLYVIYWSLEKRFTWMTEVIKTHFAGLVGAPLSAFASLLLVVILRYAVGPIDQRSRI